MGMRRTLALLLSLSQAGQGFPYKRKYIFCLTHLILVRLATIHHDGSDVQRGLRCLS